MTELAGGATFSADDPPVGKYPRANSLRNIDHDQVVHAVAFAEPDLRQGAGVGHIVHHDRQAGSLFHAGLNALNRPCYVGREDESLQVRIESAPAD